VEETRKNQDAQRDTASSSAFSAYGINKEKHTKIRNSANQRNNDKNPGKCNLCK